LAGVDDENGDVELQIVREDPFFQKVMALMRGYDYSYVVFHVRGPSRFVSRKIFLISLRIAMFRQVRFGRKGVCLAGDGRIWGAISIIAYGVGCGQKKLDLQRKTR